MLGRLAKVAFWAGATVRGEHPTWSSQGMGIAFVGLNDGAEDWVAYASPPTGSCIWIRTVPKKHD
jgi:hypothetical protein